MQRTASSILFLISFALCITSACLWIRSNRLFEELNHVTQSGAARPARDVLYGFGSASGRAYAGFLVLEGIPTNKRLPSGWHFSRSHTSSGWPLSVYLLGFQYWNTTIARGPGSGTVHARGLAIPYWFLTSAFGAWPVLHGIGAYRARKHRADRCFGLCGHCGYDLRGTVDRCPECGAVPSLLQTALTP
jgi:hypothetical protein